MKMGDHMLSADMFNRMLPVDPDNGRRRQAFEETVAQLRPTIHDPVWNKMVIEFPFKCRAEPVHNECATQGPSIRYIYLEYEEETTSGYAAKKAKFVHC
jgi:hypothetical protein